MATANKTAKSPKTVVTTLKSDDQLKVEALDAYLKAEDAATKASAKKKTAKANLMGVTEHGERITASDGRAREIQQEVVNTKQHEVLVGILAGRLGLSDGELEKLYRANAGTRTVKEVNKF